MCKRVYDGVLGVDCVISSTCMQNTKAYGDKDIWGQCDWVRFNIGI